MKGHAIRMDPIDRGLGDGPRSNPKGFTLVELMVTVAVLVILLMIAVPSLNDATLGKQLGSYANNLAASAYLARSEAIKRNARITLCASSDGTNCATSGGWQQGWIVRCPSNDGVTCVAEGTGSPVVFQRQPALPSGFSVITSGPISLRFQPTGVETGAEPTHATLIFCRASPLGHEERKVTIGATGGAAVKPTTTGSCS